MSEPLITIGPDEPVSAMTRLLGNHPVHHLPVVEGHRIIGMLSSADLMKLGFFLQAAGQANDVPPNERWRIRDLMRSPVISVTEHETVQRAAEIMTTNAIHALPVVNSNEALIGIVTTTDLMQCWLSPPARTATADAEDVRHAALDAPHIGGVLASARRQVDGNRDPHRIAETLVAIHERMRSLEQVVAAAKRYVNAGQDERLHSALRKAIERAQLFDERTGYSATLGLGIGD